MAEATSWRERPGDSSPVDDDPSLLKTFDTGDWRRNTVPGSSIIGWRCTGPGATDGHPGDWEEIHGGIGGPITLRAAYLAGSTATHQTLPLSDADGGGILIDGSSGSFTGALALRVNSASTGPFSIARSNGYVGIAAATATAPAAPLEIGIGNGSATSILLSQAATHQRIEKTSTGGLALVIPNTATPATNYFDVVIGSTSKMRIEPGASGGSNGVFTLNWTSTWNGTFAHWSTGQTLITGTAFSGSQLEIFRVTAGALTNQNASVELNDIVFDLSHSVQQTGGVNHAANRAFKILAPSHSATSALVVDDIATVYIDGAPAAGTNLTATRKEALWIGSANGGGVRMDGFGANGLVKNINGGLLTLGVAGTDYVAPWSLTNQSIVISAGGSALTEDNANAYYIVAKNRAHFLGQTVFGKPVGFFGAGSPQAPTITSAAEDFDVTETTGPYRDTGIYFPSDGMIGFTTNGLPSTVLDSGGLMTVALQARYLYGGTENGRDDESPLVIYGGAGTSSTAKGLQFRTTAPFTATSGTQRASYFNYLGAAGGFGPTSGNAGMRFVDLEYEVNQTGGASGTVYGMRISATRTAEVGAHYGLSVGDGTTRVLRVDPGITGGNALIYVGESATGNTGWAGIQFNTNARQAYCYVENATGNILIAHPQFAVTGLAAGGMVKAAAGVGQLQIASASDISTTLGLTGPAVVWTNGSGVLSVDTARFVYDSTNFKVQVPNGSATHPGVTPIGDTNTGIYSYAADVWGISTGGRHTFRVTSDSTSRYAYVGESATGISGAAVLGFDTNARSGTITLDNATGNILTVSVPWWVPNGSVTGPSLAVVGSPDTGIYRYSAGVLGVAASGREVMRFASSSTGRQVFIGATGTGITALSYLEIDTNSHAAALYVDDTISTNVLHVTERIWAHNGTAALPSYALEGTGGNLGNGGMYNYGSGVVGMAAAGRYVSRWEADATSRWLYVGENSTGITAQTWLTLQTNARSSSWYVDNATGNHMICTTSMSVSNDTTIGLSRTSAGILKIDGTNVDVPSLAGGGPVKAAAGTGRLSVDTNHPDAFYCLQLGGQFTMVTGLSGNPMSIGTGVQDFRIGVAIEHRIPIPSGKTAASIVCRFQMNSNTLDGNIELHLYFNGADQGVAATYAAAATGGVDYTKVINVSDGDKIELRVQDPSTGPNVTAGSFDLRTTMRFTT